MVKDNVLCYKVASTADFGVVRLLMVKLEKEQVRAVRVLGQE